MPARPESAPAVEFEFQGERIGPRLPGACDVRQWLVTLHGSWVGMVTYEPAARSWHVEPRCQPALEGLEASWRDPRDPQGPLSYLPGWVRRAAVACLLQWSLAAAKRSLGEPEL